MFYLAIMCIILIVASLWPFNIIFAIFSLAILMCQQVTTNNIDNLFLQVIRDIAYSVICSKIERKHIDYKKVYTKLIQEVFHLPKIIKTAKNVKIAWATPNCHFIRLAQILKPFESFCPLIHFLIKIIEIPNSNKNQLEKLFQLAFNIGQIIGNCQWYTSGITIFLVLCLQMKLRWYYTKGNTLSNEDYLHIYLHINGILNNL